MNRSSYDVFLLAPFVGLCSVASRQTTEILLNGQTTWDEYNLILFFSVALAYYFPQGRRHRHSAEYILFFVLLLIGLGISLLYSLSPSIILYLLPVIVLVILYMVNISGFIIRQIPYLKILLIVLAWTWMTAVVPMYLAEEWNILLFAERFCFLAAITLPFDIRDYDVDVEAGVLTFPQVLGLRGTKLYSAVFLLGCLAFILLYTLDELLILSYFLGLIFAAGFIFYADIKRSYYYYHLTGDGAMIVLFLFLYILTSFFS